LKPILILLLIFFVGCQSKPTPKDVISGTSATVIMAPVIIGIGSYIGVQKGMQKTAIATKMPSSTYSKLITKEELENLMDPWNKMGGTFHYIGTKHKYNYISRTSLGRQIFHISENEYQIQNQFKLTAKSWQWRKLKKKPRTFNGNVSDNLLLQLQGHYP
jgi:hypothetical protein